MRAILLVFAVTAWAQSPSFDVVSIKAADNSGGSGPRRSGCTGGPGSNDPGRITCTHVSARNLLTTAYVLKEYQVSTPDWTQSVFFDIVAKVPEDAIRDQVPAMWQNALAERFHLEVHREKKDVPIYALTVAQTGLKMKETRPEEAEHARAGFRSTPTSMHLQNGKATVAALIIVLSFSADRPILDETGLKSRYNIDLEYEVNTLSVDAPTGPPLPSMAVALEQQLGLKLEPRKGPIELLIVDRMEKSPTVN